MTQHKIEEALTVDWAQGDDSTGKILTIRAAVSSEIFVPNEAQGLVMSMQFLKELCIGELVLKLRKLADALEDRFPNIKESPDIDRDNF